MNKASLACLSAGLFLLHGAAHAQTVFTLDPTRSSLTIINATFSESINGSAFASGSLGAQAPGSTTTTYSGTLSATLGPGVTPSSITFNSAAAAGAQTGTYQPTTTAGSGAGGSGSQLADYGLTGTTSGGASTTVNAALDAVVFSLASGAIPVTGGTFAVNSINVPIAGNYGYRSAQFTLGGINTTIRGGGALVAGNPASPADASTLTGSYVVANGLATLTIPIDVTYSVTSSNLSGSGSATVVAEITGTLTATAMVPEPSTWGLLVGGTGLLGCLMRRRMSAVPIT